MIKYIDSKNKTLDMLRPEAGRWTAFIGDADICAIEITDQMIATWGRLCALDAAHLLPADCDPVVKQWLETGNGDLQDTALAAARAARRDAWSTYENIAWIAEKAVSRAAVNAAASAVWAALDSGAANAADAAAWAVTWAMVATSRPETLPVVLNAQISRMHRLIWAHHGSTLTTRERIELSRYLRYHSEDCAAMPVLPSQLQCDRWVDGNKM